MAHLKFVDDEGFLHVSTGCWVSVKRFAISAGVDDATLLRELVNLLEYQDPYDAPLGQARLGERHGPYVTTAVTADIFVQTSTERATEQLVLWFEACGYPEDRARAAEFERQALAPLARGTIYSLPPLPPETWSGYRYVGVIEGFNEFVVIDRDEQLVLVIVASDD